MLTADESDRIKLKALEQALRHAGIAHADPAPLVPTPDGWVATWTHPREIVGEHCFSYACGLTQADRTFLRIQQISSV